MDDTNHFLLSLHKYWMQANRMREDFIQEIKKLPDSADIEDLYIYCSEENNIELHTYRDFWLASLYTVIRGYQDLKLNDNTIDDILSRNKKGIKELKKFRDSTRHFELPTERNKKFVGLKNLSMTWIQGVHLSFNEYFSYHLITKHTK